QNPGGFQRAQQVQQAGNILDTGFTDLLERLLGDQGAATVPGEQLGEQGPVFGVADDMAARQAGVTGLAGRRQQRAGQAGTQRLDQRQGAAGLEFAQQLTVGIQNTGIRAEQDQLVRFQRSSGADRHIFTGQIEYLTGGRVAQRGQQ